jgi:membrane-associated phospholipid phosphatase
MIRGSIAFSAFIFLFLIRSYSQVDSTSMPTDTTAINNVSETRRLETIKLKRKTNIYTLKPAIDIPIIAIGTGFSLFAFTTIYDKPPSTEEEINNLKRSDINAFDRWAIYPYSNSLSNISAYEFHGSIPLPVILFLITKETRQDFWKLSFLYWEALSITGLFGSGAPYFIDRHRPYAYTSETPMEKRMIPNAKNSAFSGHVEVVATSVFFTAKVYSDYYPETKLMVFGLASVATGGMAYLRLKGGQHFPSDVLIGAALGTLSGILVPHFHKHKLIKNPDLSITPFNSGRSKGLSLTYKLH